MEPEPSLQERLVYVAQKGDLATLRACLAAGANIDAGFDGSWNALHNAIEMGHVETVRYLLVEGADPNVLAGGLRPLQHVIDVESDGTAQTGEEGLEKPVLIELLLEAGADVNGKNIWGETPLQTALRWGHQPAIELLKARGAS